MVKNRGKYLIKEHSDKLKIIYMKIISIKYQRSIMLGIIWIMIILFGSCKKEDRMDYLDSKAPAPVQVSDVKVKNLPGKAVLTYKIPDDPNFYYAKAEYETKPNVYMETKASIYNDTLLLEGFGDTLPHDIKIYSVGRNEKESEALTVQVHPLTPPVISVYKSINIVPTFGGVQVSFKNPSTSHIGIVVMEDTTNQNTWTTLQRFNTGADSGVFSIRNLDSLNRKFAVFVTDRWDNLSDTLLQNLKPLFEQEVPKPYSVWILPTDQTAVASGLAITHLWDGSFPDISVSYASANNSTLPQWVTIDLGRNVLLSRVVEHQSNHPDHCYNGSAPKVVEIWGSNNPASDGSWASWDSLGTFKSYKPSGLPLGQTTDDDINYACIQGESFEFSPVLTKTYRYIRWKTDETYASIGQVVISELDFYGQIK